MPRYSLFCGISPKLIQYANALIVVWNPEFIITRFNEAFEVLSGYATEEVIGSHISSLLSPESWTETLEMRELSRSGMQWEAVEIPVRCKSGEMKIVLWNFANIYAADETTLTAVIAQGQDITERVRREISPGCAACDTVAESIAVDTGNVGLR